MSAWRINCAQASNSRSTSRTSSTRRRCCIAATRDARARSRIISSRLPPASTAGSEDPVPLRADDVTTSTSGGFGSVGIAFRHPQRPRALSCAVVAVLLFGPLAAFAQPAAPKKIGIGLYGSNGHQISLANLAVHPHARLVAVAALRATTLPEDVKRFASLEELLADPAVALVSLCSPRRADQARDAIRCLEAGKHVYAEKPAALTEADLDRILAAAKRSGKEFHEMAGTAFAPNYAIMRRLVGEGAVGEVIQVFVQKSYRYGAARPVITLSVPAVAVASQLSFSASFV
ncbi:MAG: Gfo/Idh/MocA family oxidoreductase [Opitutus sp.]|nr:Gfo/Idh/MocA family oxidoreductase [Opitutus sp.]